MYDLENFAEFPDVREQIAPTFFSAPLPRKSSRHTPLQGTPTAPQGRLGEVHRPVPGRPLPEAGAAGEELVFGRGPPGRPP